MIETTSQAAVDRAEQQAERLEAALRDIRDVIVTGSEAEWIAWARETAAVALVSEAGK